MSIGLADRDGVRMVEQLGGQLEIAGLARHLGGEVVTHIVEAEAGRAGQVGATADVIPQNR